MEYYDKKIEELRHAVDKCSSEVSTIMQYFIKEANAHSSGIPREVEKEVDNLSFIFFSKCGCVKVEDKEPTTRYQGGPYFSKTGITPGYGRRKGPYTN